MQVSVIIASYNRFEYIKSLLEQLNEQTLLPLQVIVVDQSETKYEIFNQDFKYGLIHIKTSTRGPCSARNLGADYANGDVLVFLDDDVSCPNNFIEEITQPIKFGEKAVCGLVLNESGTCNMTNFGDYLKVDRPFFKKLTSSPDCQQNGISFSIPMGCSAITKSLFYEIGKLDEFFDPNGAGEDRDISFRILLSGNQIVYRGNAQVRHLKSMKGGRRDRIIVKEHFNILDYNLGYSIKKNFGKETFLEYKVLWIFNVLRKSKFRPYALKQAYKILKLQY